jgi:Domain of unknown function (DUF3303)
VSRACCPTSRKTELVSALGGEVDLTPQRRRLIDIAVPAALFLGSSILVAESSDAEAIAKWTQTWTDLLSFEVTPVVTDEQLARVIG